MPEIFTQPARAVTIVANAVFAVALLTFGSPALAAINYSFEGSDAGGTGKATVSFNSPVGDTLQIDINNTSSIYLDNGGEWNAPGITKVGFDLELVPLESLVGWSLQADKYENGVFTQKTIGSSTGICDGNCRWEMTLGGGVGNVTFEYLPETENGVKGALYNPLIATTLDPAEPASNPFYTEAYLTLQFSNSLTSALPSNLLVRMQNVGLNGAGSLKLTCPNGEPGCGENGNGGDVPEPATLALLAVGLAGLRYRKRVLK